MRALLAYDGSSGAAQAATLTGAIAWPSDSTLRVVSAIGPMPMLSASPWAGGMPTATTPDLETQVTAYFEAETAEVVKRLQSPGRSVEGAVLRGRPASVLVDEAHAFGADVVIVGSRGQGPIAELLLGSVSSEVVDHAGCPVLVARQPGIRRILFASDGSPSALAAEAVLADWPVFDGLPIRVVSVADVVQPWHTGIAPTMYRQVLDAYAKDLEESQAEHGRVADESARRLREAGREAESHFCTGDPAVEIIAVAGDWDADLIVLGSRGRTGLTRVLLGSVARNVVHGSRASVLVVRDPDEV